MPSTSTFSPPPPRRTSRTTTTTATSRHRLPSSLHHNFHYFDLVRNNDNADHDIILHERCEASRAECDFSGHNDDKHTQVTQLGGYSLGTDPHPAAMSTLHDVALLGPNLVALDHSAYGIADSFDSRSLDPREFISVDAAADDDDDDDCDMREGDSTLDFPILSEEETSAMDHPDFYGVPSSSASEDESDHTSQTTMISGPQTIPLPLNIPPHLQLPQPSSPPLPMLELGEVHPGAAAAEQLAPIQDDEDDEDDEFDELIQTHPMALSAPNTVALAPENHDVVTFLRHWLCPQHELGVQDTARQVRGAILRVAKEEVSRIECRNLEGDWCDLQGINWRSFGLTREDARRRRRETYVNYVNRSGSDEHNPIQHVENDSNFFRFRGMNLKRDVRLLHFQLRNILACTSRSRAFYASTRAVREINPEDGATKIAMSLGHDTETQISTLTATQDLLLVGGFFGDYRYKCLDSDDSAVSVGLLTNHPSGITNHVQVYNDRRSSRPLAAFASNDFGFRMVDLSTNQLISEQMHDCIINCTAMSPDRRLRVMVGDHQDAFIADAETGQVLQNLEGHSDFGFACDWAPDGWTVATGNQDRTIRVWDARYWRRPIAVMPTQLSGARSLRFSPLGSGKRVLAAAEEADYLNIIDAENFMHKQTFDMFGEIGGVEFTNGGSDLLALSSDYYRGGLLQLRRCDAGAEDTITYPEGKQGRYDWLPTSDGVLQRPNSEETMTQRRRQAFLTTGELTPL